MTTAESFTPAARVLRINESPSTAAAARARELKAQGRDILDLTVGEPDFDTPENIKQAAIEAIGRGETKYTPVNGTPALRDAIVARLAQHTGITYGTDRITVGGGAKQIIFLALMATVDTGTEVIIPAPYWVSYPDMCRANDGEPVIVPCPREDGFKLTPERLSEAITDRTRWLILNTPSNPTGAAYTESELRALADVLLAHPHVSVLTDEIYDEVWYEQTAALSIVSVEPGLKDRVLLVNGVSKTYAMTGWRIGYAAGPAGIIAAINKLQSQMSSCPSSISQAAAAEALSGDQTFVAESVAVYRERRDRVIGLLEKVPGLSCTVPSGAFYLFVGCEGLIGRRTPDGRVLDTDQDVTLYLLEQGVAVIHGGAYGASPYFRASFSTSMAVLEDACGRIAAACAALT
ncbi:aspartate transaminase [Streptomyces sp. NPDC088400]|uniref:aspartate transaminase n=1 Tax=Streptomyces sp. NPDC088400 TaxID=3365861 RepID=UPI00382047CF